MATASINMTGYQRMALVNRVFFTTDIQHLLMNNIGKNERVIINEYLTGTCKTAIQSPRLPSGLQEQIHESHKNNPGSDLGVWMKKLSRLLSVGQVFSIMDMSSWENWYHMLYVIRFMNTYFIFDESPNRADYKPFSKTVVKKCQEQLLACERREKSKDEFHVYNTRSNSKKFQQYQKFESVVTQLKQELKTLLVKYSEFLQDD